MTVQQLRYLLEISRTGSVTKAAEQLYISQPNLSRAVKELEKELGVTLFRRGARGMEPTAEAAQIMRYAESIVQQMDELESMYAGGQDNLRFCFAAPHTSYLTRGFADFLARQNRPLDVRYLELSTQAALDAVVRGEAQLGVVRYQAIYEEHFKEVISQSGLAWRVLLQFEAWVLLGQDHPLAGQERLCPRQLAGYTQLIEGEVQLPVDENGRVTPAAPTGQSRVYLQDRASQYEMLRRLPGSYLWSAPLPQSELNRRGLVQKRCGGGTNRDLAVWRAKNGLGPTARDCLAALQSAARRQSYL